MIAEMSAHVSPGLRVLYRVDSQPGQMALQFMRCLA
jgi:hypothetical protein